MRLEKRRRAPQDRVVKIISKIGNHAETGIIHQVRASVIENPFEYRGRDQCESHDRPRILEV